MRLVYGIEFHAIPAMDQACFLSSSVSHVNCANVVFYGSKITEEITNDNLLKLMKFLPKFYYEMKEYAGDYYYTAIDTDIERCKQIAIQKAVTINTG